MPVQHVALMAQDYFELAYELQMRGDIERAVYYYKRSLDCMPSPEAYTFWAWSESMRGGYEEAIELCKEAIALDSDFGNPWNDIGAYLLALEHYEEAIPFLEQALRSPRYLTYHYAHYNLGRAYEKLTDLEHARRKYQDALAQEPTYLLAREALERLEQRAAKH
ncbi:MAG: tetratricopeptide repeat protein [Candidatus Latescibacterota bacterium]|nr:MAG: tetratricopeptide repeat protein [Candidatus Latescibacterota bacterium]